MLWKALLFMSLGSNLMLWLRVSEMRQVLAALAAGHVGRRAHDAMVLDSAMPQVIVDAGRVDMEEHLDRKLGTSRHSQ
jgi:hypothetical protein